MNMYAKYNCQQTNDDSMMQLKGNIQ